jgi:mitochondrial chaperone BCS1
VAGELGLNVYILSLSRTGLDDQSLSSTLAELPGECILLMEGEFCHSIDSAHVVDLDYNIIDIDAAFNRGITRETTDSSASKGDDSTGENTKREQPGPVAGPPVAASRVTLSGLLNALDGVGAQEGRIVRTIFFSQTGHQLII